VTRQIAQDAKGSHVVAPPTTASKDEQISAFLRS